MRMDSVMISPISQKVGASMLLERKLTTLVTIRLELSLAKTDISTPRGSRIFNHLRKSKHGAALRIYSAVKGIPELSWITHLWHPKSRCFC